jgi:steroid 5-alpha reductase family enzyme
MTWQTLLLAALAQWAALAAIMAVGWYAWTRTRNSGWVDVTWTFAVGLVGAASTLAPIGPDDWCLNRIVAAAMIIAWAMRLGLYIADRTAGVSDDPRYAKFIEGWGDAAPRNMFWFLQAQAFFAMPLTLAVTLAAINPAPFWSVGPVLGLALFATGIIGSTLSDRHLARFKVAKQAGTTDAVICDSGLWAWSRHPNYFFETVIWTSYAVFALDFTSGWAWGYVAFVAPICIYWLLRYVSGVPPLEEHMVARYGDAYRAYQRRVSVFVPLPPGERRTGVPRVFSNSEG